MRVVRRYHVWLCGSHGRLTSSRRPGGSAWPTSSYTVLWAPMQAGRAVLRVGALLSGLGIDTFSFDGVHIPTHNTLSFIPLATDGLIRERS